MRGLVMTLAAAALVVPALAQTDLKAQRRVVMVAMERASNGGTNVVLGKYRADKALAATDKLKSTMAEFMALFPPGPYDGDPAAMPAIWEDPEGFQAMADLLVLRADEAALASAEGQAAFTLAWGAVLEACTACHETYRSTN